MAIPSIVIRIQAGTFAADWAVEKPNVISFSDTLAAINKFLQDQPTETPATVQAFEYEDEDCDRITVRSDDEQNNMLAEYFGTYMSHGGTIPLIIYPRIGKSADKRNKKGLKINCREDEEQRVPSNNNSAGHMSPMDHGSAGSGSRKRSGDIHKILTCGRITHADIEYGPVVGSGNCGTVHRAQLKATHAPLAVKVIPLDISVDAKNQIISELAALDQCNSPLIISFYGAYFLENRISICTEWMDGGSLDRYGQIPEYVLGVIAVSVVKGLQYLWSLKIMHRDVKPSNILVNSEGGVKLCDFGVSIQLIDSIAKTFIGTNAYMAPERINGQQYSIESDVWSLGIALFEMGSGVFPYESAKRAASKPIDLLKSIVEKEPPQLPLEYFSTPFADFVSQCMKKNPHSRPAPEALMRHPFIAQYVEADNSIVAAWLAAHKQAALLMK